MIILSLSAVFISLDVTKLCDKGETYPRAGREEPKWE
jgi:hypothetical protein